MLYGLWQMRGRCPRETGLIERTKKASYMLIDEESGVPKWERLINTSWD
jgi:hypothetical protein